MAAIVVLALIAMPLLSLTVQTARAHDMPCPHMAALDMAESHTAHRDHGHHGMQAGTDMDCCEGEAAVQAAPAMADCDFICKSECMPAVLAVLPAPTVAAPPIRSQAMDDSPPARLTPHSSGFATPPPRI